MVVEAAAGDIVRLHGLQNKGASLNESLAVVLAQLSSEPQAEQDSSQDEVRWVVRPMGHAEDRPVSVRAQNLRFARRAPDQLCSLLSVAAAVSAAVAALAHGAGPGSWACGLAPACSLLWYVVTVAGCYWLHVPLLSSGVLVPAISEMGVSHDARLLYRVGFGLCGSLLAVTVLQLSRLAEQVPLAAEEASVQLSGGSQGASPSQPGIGWGLLAAAGIALQGICTLRVDFGAETLAHFGGAMLTMFATMQHAQESNDWFSALPDNSPLLRKGWPGAGLWIRRDMIRDLTSSGVGLLLFMVPLALQAASRLGMLKDVDATQNWAGVMQWILVAGIAIFFSSYAFDLVIS